MHIIKLCSKGLNEKLKAQAEQFLLVCQNGFRKGRSCVNQLIEKRKRVWFRNSHNISWLCENLWQS